MASTSGPHDWADVLAFHIRALNLPAPAREHHPFADRKFRLDLSWPDRWLFAECDGGEWTHGRHGRGRGMQTDCEKWNLLTLAGWRGLRFVGSQIRSGYAIEIIERALK